MGASYWLAEKPNASTLNEYSDLSADIKVSIREPVPWPQCCVTKKIVILLIFFIFLDNHLLVPTN